MVTATKEKPKAKKVKKVAKAKSEREVEHGIDRKSDLPWCEKKVKLFKALKALKAIGSATSAVGANKVIEKDGTLSGKDVRHYSYAARAAGLIDVYLGLEGIHGHGFTLTAKGAKLDPAKEYKEQEAAKAKKE